MFRRDTTTGLLWLHDHLFPSLKQLEFAVENFPCADHEKLSQIDQLENTRDFLVKIKAELRRREVLLTSVFL